MSKQESNLQRTIQEKIKEQGGIVLKTQGINRGTPDLIGSIKVVDVFIPFAFEVKTSDTKDNVTPKQRYELQKFASQGWCTGVVTSIEDVNYCITKFIEYKYAYLPLKIFDTNK